MTPPGGTRLPSRPNTAPVYYASPEPPKRTFRCLFTSSSWFLPVVFSAASCCGGQNICVRLCVCLPLTRTSSSPFMDVRASTPFQTRRRSQWLIVRAPVKLRLSPAPLPPAGPPPPIRIYTRAHVRAASVRENQSALCKHGSGR